MKKDLFNINELMMTHPYSVNERDKSIIYNRALKFLNEYHYQNCSEYKSIVDMLNSSKTEDSNYDEFIFLPVSLFKDYELRLLILLN